MEKMNMNMMKLMKRNRRVITGVYNLTPYVFEKPSDVTVPPYLLAITAAVRGRRLERINEKLIWSYPAEFRGALEFLYMPIYRKPTARLTAVPSETEPENIWVEEIDPAPAKAIGAVVIIDGEVDDIVNPKAEGDVVDLVDGADRIELNIVPIGTIRKNAGPLASFFAGYGLPRAPRRSDLYDEE